MYLTLTVQQSVSHVPQLSQFKKEIEGRFSAIKAACSPQPSGHPPRLTADLQAWYVCSYVLLLCCIKFATSTGI